MLFDSSIMFFRVGTGTGFTAGEFTSLIGMTSGGSFSNAINLGNPRDMGTGQGQERPNVQVIVGTALTSSEGTSSVFVSFQGSTDSVTWTTYANYGAASVGFSGSWGTGSSFNFVIPERPPGAALPLYYRLGMGLTSGTGTVGLSTGTIMAGIVLADDEGARTGMAYKAGFTVA
jgi:hypothetical protein